MYASENYTECIRCGKQLVSPQTKRNKFCGSSCAATYNNNISRAPKRVRTGDYRDCLSCGKTNYYRPSDLLKGGKYCSNRCQRDYEWKERVLIIESHGVEVISNYEPTQREILKKYLIWKHVEECMKCGWSEINEWTGRIPIQLDHIDGDPHNQSLDNVQLLCASCHSLTEFFGSRGKGRKGMIRSQMKNKKEYLEEVYGR
tara:strand:- start:47 stop:649 length:603 start_codon:yes stop_codon:yes gene_type:complete